jgi:putative addiction module component (TIGR02574 family)
MATQSGLDSWRSLSIAEKLRLVEDIWDDIGKSAEELPLQPWHREVVEQRIAELDADPSIAITHDEFLKRIGYRDA